MSPIDDDTFAAGSSGAPDPQLDDALRAALAPGPIAPEFQARLRRVVADEFSARRARRLTRASAGIAAALLLTLALARGPGAAPRGAFAPSASPATDWSDSLDSSIAMIENELDELHVRVAAETLSRLRVAQPADDWDKPADQASDSDAPTSDGARSAPAVPAAGPASMDTTPSLDRPLSTRPRRLA